MPSHEMGTIIYLEFEVDQSCTVTGFEMIDKKVQHKGQNVLNEIERRDRLDNMLETKQGFKRKAKKWANSVGGHKANKCFRWSFNIIDNEPRYIIWRVQ